MLVYEYLRANSETLNLYDQEILVIIIVIKWMPYILYVQKCSQT